MNLALKEILSFRRMVTPFLVKVIFWIGLVICWSVGIRDLLQSKFLLGILLLTLGTLAVRIFCEVLILFFQINNTLLDILKCLKTQSGKSD